MSGGRLNEEDSFIPSLHLAAAARGGFRFTVTNKPVISDYPTTAEVALSNPLATHSRTPLSISTISVSISWKIAVDFAGLITSAGGD